MARQLLVLFALAMACAMVVASVHEDDAKVNVAPLTIPAESVIRVARSPDGKKPVKCGDSDKICVNACVKEAGQWKCV